MFETKTSMLIVLMLALVSFGCSGGDSGTNTDLGAGEPVAPDEVTIPAGLRAVADAGDDGAQTLITMVRLIEQFDSLSAILRAPDGAVAAGAPSFAPLADSTWQWTDDNLTYTLAYTETETEYLWVLVADGISSGGAAYDGFVMAEMAKAKDGSSGSFTKYHRAMYGYTTSYEWSVSGTSLTMTARIGITAYYCELVATVESDGSGVVVVYLGDELIARIVWDGDGHGQWWNYQESDEGTF
jgi:hypothetical protein